MTTKGVDKKLIERETVMTDGVFGRLTIANENTVTLYRRQQR